MKKRNGTESAVTWMEEESDTTAKQVLAMLNEQCESTLRNVPGQLIRALHAHALQKALQTISFASLARGPAEDGDSLFDGYEGLIHPGDAQFQALRNVLGQRSGGEPPRRKTKKTPRRKRASKQQECLANEGETTASTRTQPTTCAASNRKPAGTGAITSAQSVSSA